VSPRTGRKPLPEVPEGVEYAQNVKIIGKMLNVHDEFTESLNRKIRIVARGDKITNQAMNPVILEKVDDVIRQLDKVNLATQNFD